MVTVTNAFTGLIEQAAINIPVNPGDYEKDGLLYCGFCHTPKECFSVFLGHEFKHRCLCSCAEEARNAETAERKEHEAAERIASMKSVGMQDAKFRACTFETAEPSKLLNSMKRYCNAWVSMLESNTGLLLSGSCGSGKTFAAACIANELLAKGIPVLMTNTSRVLNELQAHYDDRNDFIKDICKYPLLILDDFGIERNTEYAAEQVYNLIDARYRSGKPLIVTTNLTPDEMRGTGDLARKRIYDRILEMCCCQFNFGESGRRSAIAENKRSAAIAAIKGE